MAELNLSQGNVASQPEAHHHNEESDLHDAFDDMNLGNIQIYDVEGLERAPVADKVWTARDLRAANAGTSLKRKLLPFTTPRSQISMEEVPFDHLADEWSAQHRLDYMQVRGACAVLIDIVSISDTSDVYQPV